MIGDRVIASALGVVAVLFVVAALARGAQLPLPAWLRAPWRRPPRRRPCCTPGWSTPAPCC
ncbi:MAG: hypothetical protein R2699_11895 [Acidimicrobiales bacterium]